MKKKIIVTILVVFILFIAGVSFSGYYWYNTSKNFLLNNNITTEINIEKGHSYGQLYN